MSVFKETVAERLAQVLETGKFFDLEFLFMNGEKIEGHKLIFAVSSPVFEAMFYNDMPEKNKIVIIEDIEPYAFKTMTKFIYSDYTKLDSINHAMGVYKAAHKYNIPKLERMTEDYIVLNIRGVDDVLKYFEFANFYSSSKIKNVCLQLIQNQTEPILRSNQFFTCSLNTLEAIVNQDKLSVSEIELFNYVEQWALNNAKKEGTDWNSLLPLLRYVISNIRFLSMSVTDFLKYPFKSQLLTNDEKSNILMNLNEPNKHPMPYGFSNCAYPRSAVGQKYPSLNSSWSSNKLGDTSSFQQNNLQSNSGNYSIDPILDNVPKGMTFEYLLVDGFKPSSKISFTGVALDTSDRFRIDFHVKDIGRGKTVANVDDVDIALHFNPRFDEQVVVRNSSTVCAWMDCEEREGPFVFSKRSGFVIDFYCWKDAFQVFINGSVFCYYKHRVDPTLISHVSVGGCFDVHSVVYHPIKGNQFISSVPDQQKLESFLAGGFRPSSRITLMGVVLSSPERFKVDLFRKSQPNTNGDGDIALHFNPRFDQQSVIRNSKTNGCWGNEERHGGLKFYRGHPFVLDIFCQEKEFQVIVNGNVFCHYRHRMDPLLITHIAVSGCVDIHSAIYYSHKGARQKFTVMGHGH